MPELPEVETIARHLRQGNAETPAIVGWYITGAELRWERTLAEPSPADFLRRITGQRITGVGRRAKYLLICLDQDTLVIHLRMSGDLRVENASDPPALHHRLWLNFENGSRLAFNDPRKFGRIWLLRDPAPLFAKLGPEPLEGQLTPDGFHALLNGRRRQLKPLLLDQTFLAGIGNIYADESLHRAGLHPQSLASSLSPEQSARLLAAIRQALTTGIERNGASIDWVYRGGDFQNYFQVYDRRGKPCYTCGTPIERITVGQRGTHYCPTCQRPTEG